MDPDSKSQGRPNDPINAVFHLYDPPLWLVTSGGNSRRGGCIATFVVRASIVAELPRMIVGIAKHHYTWQLIETTGVLALHLLRTEDLDAVWRFGLQSGRDTDKLADLPDTHTPLGNPLYREAAAWMDCRVEDQLDIGDRTVYLAEATGAEVLCRGPVLGVNALMRTASPPHRAELERLYQADQAIDTQAILAWRRSRGDDKSPGHRRKRTRPR